MARLQRVLAHGLTGGLLLALAGIAAIVSRSWCLNRCLQAAEQADIEYDSCMEKCEDLESKLQETLEEEQAKEGKDPANEQRSKYFLECERTCDQQHPKVGSADEEGVLPQDIYADEVACDGRCWPPGWLGYGVYHFGIAMLLPLTTGLVSGRLDVGCLGAFAPSEGRGGLEAHRNAGGPAVLYAWLFLALALFLFIVGLSSEVGAFVNLLPGMRGRRRDRRGARGPSTRLRSRRRIPSPGRIHRKSWRPGR
mmetsp:Transcript_10226/g.26375  ORF Transcript_10226/g.26375 Transcript_10226/m.26375 type:complete len:252 (-) Transcript_10226:309-1064(-)